MKSLFFTTCSSLVFFCSNVAFGQGMVSFNNTTTTVFNTNAVAVGGSSGRAAGSINGGAFRYEVLTAPSSVTSVDLSLQELLTAPWSDTLLTASNTALAGR